MTYDCWTLPHKTNNNCLTWNYYSKYINLTNSPHINNNLTKLTGRPIITAHSWITSNPLCLLGIELDRITLQLKNLFKERNIPYPLIYNWYDLLLMLDKLHILPTCTTCVLQLLISHPFTPTYHTMTLLEPSSWAANCLICQTFIGTIYLTSTKTKLFYCWWYLLSAIRGSIWIVTIADKLWNLCSHHANFLFLTITNCPTKKHF